ncbi:MAG: hypothetical protein K2H74_08840, partial [Paramuribaculum sp.]|nr:hypothetical protein [Paramuribaculum sp.]
DLYKRHAQNKNLASFGGSGYTGKSPYAYRLLVPYDALGKGSLSANPMTAADSYTVAAWMRLYTLSVTSAQLKEKGATLMSFGTDKNCDYGGNWNLTVTTPGSKKPFNVAIRGTEGESGSAAEVGFAGSECKDIPYNEWIYLAVVVDNTNLKANVYINGEVAAEANLSAPMIYSGDDAVFSVGGIGISTLYLDELDFFNTALTAQEVMTAQFNPYAIESLQSMYGFDEKTGDNEFSNILYNGNSATAKFVQSKGSVAMTAGEGIKNVTNEAYKYCTPGTCNRVIALPVDVDPEIQNGTLAIKVGDNEPVASTNVTPGTAVTLVGTPADGYKLVDYYAIVGGGKQVVEGNTFNVQKPTTFSAEFTNQFYPLTIENSANIPYTLTLRGEEVTDLDNLIPGTNYYFTLNVPDEYLLQNVTLNEKVVHPDYTGVYTIKITEASTLVVNAAMRKQYTVTFPTYEHGVVKVLSNGVEVASGATVLEGTVLTIKVDAAEGYAASSILLNGAKILNGSTYTANRDIEISAEFIESNVEHCTPSPLASRSNGSTSKTTGRYFNSAVISDGSSSLEISTTGNYANAAFGSTSGRPVYDASAVVPQFIVDPGKTISITTTGAGQWMDVYVYLDSDLNGLDSSDLLISQAGGGTNFCGTQTISIPLNAKTGVYRMRYVLNWMEKGEDGKPLATPNPCEYGQENKDNGEVVFDVDFVVVADEVAEARTISVVSENATYGSVAIVDPATDEASITTKTHYVTVEATPAEGFAFINWTNAEGNVVSSAPSYVYEGTADIELTAHFGRTVTYSIEGNGSVIVTTADGAHVANGGVVAVGSQVVFSLTPAAGKTVGTLTVNGEEHVGDIVDNTYTVEINENTVVAIGFTDFTAHVSWTVRGNGEVEAGYEWNDEFTGVADNFASGDAISSSKFSEVGGLTFFAYPGQTENGDYESIESVTLQMGETDIRDITEEVNAGCDGGENEDGLLPDGAPFLYYTVSELPSADMMIVFVFTDKGAAASIGNIFGDDNTDAPTLYYNLDGVRVNGNA